MSSVLRSKSQTPSTFFWSHGADIFDLDAIKAAFRGENGSNYSGPEPEYSGNFILFDTEEHFADATYELLFDASNTFYAESYVTVKDLGKNLYIGVKGKDSQMLTMSLVKANGNDAGTSSFGIGYGLTAINVSNYVDNYYDGDIEIDLIRGGV
jgi:hypothetical protein